MRELHTPGPWASEKSTEDYQGHFITGGGRTVAATYTVEPTDVTKEDHANASLMVAAPAMLKALRRIARDADFAQEEGAMNLGQRVVKIERDANAAIALYERPLAGGNTSEAQSGYTSIRDWFRGYDHTAKLEGWLLTNDSNNYYCIARLDDPRNVAGIPDWPADFIEPKFQNDEEAVEFVRGKAAAGSQWHAQSLAIHDARIPVRQAANSGNLPLSRQLTGAILEHCSAGPWRHGLRLLPFSADSQPCVYGDERELPLAMLVEDDREASANVVLMAAAWELYQELGLLVSAALAAGEAELPRTASSKLQRRCNSALALLTRIRSDIEKSSAERYGEEQADE